MKAAEVLGAPVTVASLEALTAAIMARAKAGEGGHVCAANVHMVTLARRDPDLMAAMRGAAFVACDGMPLVWYLRRHGHGDAVRVPGPDLMAELVARAEGDRLPVFLLGGGDALRARLVERLLAHHPGLVLAGCEGPHVPARPGADPLLVARVAASGARLVLVGLGCPKQELWMAANAGALPAVLVGVGAAFAFHAGTLRRAPAWMRRAGLEWLHRLVREPRRLGPRYALTNTLFIADCLAEAIRGR